MKLGMTLPTMVPGYHRGTVLDWCRRLDEGPYSSISAGERITFGNQEQLVTLSAAAALTSRVRVVPTIVILPMHPAPLVAKRMSTLDVLSGGRLTLGLGVGGREDDYRAAGAAFDHRLARLDDGVAELRRLWAGEPPFDGADPVGPPPAQIGGPPLLCSSMGPKSLRRAARWADGFAGFTAAAGKEELADVVSRVRAAWADAGRGSTPYLMTSCWFSLGPDAPARHRAYVERYLAIDPGIAELMVDMATIHSADALRAAVEHAQAAGFDELMLVPTTADLAELDRLEELFAT